MSRVRYFCNVFPPIRAELFGFLGNLFLRHGTYLIEVDSKYETEVNSSDIQPLIVNRSDIRLLFEKGENVIVLDQNNVQLARGLSSFSSTEIDKIKGKQSKQIETILGYLSKTEVIHKDDMVLL